METIFKFGADPGFTIFEQIAMSDYFIHFLLENPASQVWYAIPSLMRTSKILRTGVVSRLPEPFKKMLLILGTGKRHRGADYNIQSLVNCREVLSKLYITGVLPVYLKYIPDSHIARKYIHWRQLNMIPVAQIDCFDEYFELLSMLPHTGVNYNSHSFTSCDGNRAPPNDMYNYLKNFQDWTMNELNIRNLYDFYAINNDAADTVRDTSFRSQVGLVYTEYRVLKNGQSTRYSAPDLPQQTQNLNYYIGAIWINRYPEFVTRFYQAFGATMPMIPDKKITDIPMISSANDPDVISGAWNRLFLCALFDLDLSIICDRSLRI